MCRIRAKYLAKPFSLHDIFRGEWTDGQSSRLDLTSRSRFRTRWKRKEFLYEGGVEAYYTLITKRSWITLLLVSAKSGQSFLFKQSEPFFAQHTYWMSLFAGKRIRYLDSRCSQIGARPFPRLFMVVEKSILYFNSNSVNEMRQTTKGLYKSRRLTGVLDQRCEFTMRVALVIVLIVESRLYARCVLGLRLPAGME